MPPKPKGPKGPEKLAYEPLCFNEETLEKTDRATYIASHPIWDANSQHDRHINSPNWVDPRYGPLPPAKPPSGKKHTLKNLYTTKAGCTEEEARQAESAFISEAKASTGRIRGSRALLNLKTANIPRGIVQSYLGFVSGAAATTFILTQGTEIVGYYLKALQEQRLKFPIAEIANIINAADTTDKYVQGLVAMVDKDRKFEPMAKSTSIKSTRMADKTSASGKDNMAVSGMLCVFRLLRWMTKGRDWDAQKARELWDAWEAENPDARDEERLAFFDTELDSEERFTRHMDADPAEAYLGYSKEDWSRAHCMLATIFTSWKSIWEQLGDKRGGELFVIPYESELSLQLSLATDGSRAAEKDRQRLDAIAAMARVTQEVGNTDVQESMFRSVINNLVRAGPGMGGSGAGDIDFVQGMEEVGRQMRSINDYMGLTHHASAISKAAVGREHAQPVNPIDNPITTSNPGVASFGRKAAQEYIANSPDTLDALRDEYMAQDPNLDAEEATEKARDNMAATHSLSSFTSGDIPTDPPWAEALAALGFEPDVVELIFNEINTRVTMDQAVAASQAPGATASTNQELLSDAPRLLPHQVKDVSIALRYLKGIGALLNANAMGLGKSLIAELVAYALSLIAEKPGAKGPFGPHVFVCQTELLIQYTVDSLRFFYGLRKYYIVSATPMKPPRNDIKVIYGPQAWREFQHMLYEKRDDPALTKMTVVMTTQLLESRLLTNSTTVVFSDGEEVKIGRTLRRAPKTPRRHAFAGRHHQWAGEMASSQVDGEAAEPQPEPQDEPGSDDELEPEYEPESEPEEDGKDKEPAPTSDFYTACREIYKKYKQEGQQSGPSFGEAKTELEIRQGSKDSSDKRTSLDDTIEGVQLLQIYLRKQGVRTGQAAWAWVKKNNGRIPVSGKKQTYMSDTFFPEGYTKNGQWPTWYHVTFDEAHGLRNYGTVQHSSAILVPKRTMLLLTGTPLYNSMGDFRAYMVLFAAQCGIDMHLVLVADDVKQLDRTFTCSRDLLTMGLVTKQDGCVDGFIDKLFEWADEDLSRRAWWCLLKGFRAMAGSSNETVRLVACRMFAHSFISRRTMSTPLVDHHGRTVYPTSGLLPCHVRTTYVRHTDDRAMALAVLTDLMHAQVKKANEERAARAREGPTRAPPEGLSDEQRVEAKVRHVLNLAQAGETTQASSLGYNRVMTQIATDHHIFRLYFDPDVNKRDPLQKLSAKEIADVRRVIEQSNDPSAKLPENLASDRASSARLGRKDVATMATFDNYGGMTYFYSMLNDTGLIPSNDVAHMVTWCLSKSPALFELVRTLEYGFSRPDIYGDRVMIVVQSPLIESMVSGLLRLMGLNVISFTADLSASDRGKLLGNFTDPNCHVNALVVPSTMTLSGMNMHNACHWGIMVGLDESSAKAKQAIGRLSRIGQTREVYWALIIMLGSNMRSQERACHTKEMNTASVMAPITTDITTDLRTIMCFEVAKEQFGAPMSLYTVSHHHEEMKSVTSYEEPWVARFASFYSMLATLGLGDIAPTGDAVKDKANAIRLCHRMQRLSPWLNVVCLMVEIDNGGDPEHVRTFALEVNWDIIDEYIGRAETEGRKANNDTEAVLQKFALQLARLMCGCGPDTGLENPAVRDKYAEAMDVARLSFTPPSPPEPEPEPPSMGEQSQAPEQHKQAYSKDSWDSLANASDPNGLYEALGANLTDSTQDLFLRYTERRPNPDLDDDEDYTDEDRAERVKKRERLDLAAAILCSAHDRIDYHAGRSATELKARMEQRKGMREQHNGLLEQAKKLVARDEEEAGDPVKNVRRAQKKARKEARAREAAEAKAAAEAAAAAAAEAKATAEAVAATEKEQAATKEKETPKEPEGTEQPAAAAAIEEDSFEEEETEQPAAAAAIEEDSFEEETEQPAAAAIEEDGDVVMEDNASGGEAQSEEEEPLVRRRRPTKKITLVNNKRALDTSGGSSGPATPAKQPKVTAGSSPSGSGDSPLAGKGARSKKTTAKPLSLTLENYQASKSAPALRAFAKSMSINIGNSRTVPQLKAVINEAVEQGFFKGDD